MGSETALLIADFGGFVYLMLRNSDPLIEKTLFIFIVDFGGFAYTKGPKFGALDSGKRKKKPITTCCRFWRI